MKKPYLSIIIPTYNSEETLKLLLDSIFGSSFTDFEMIVIDDLSTDGTSRFIKDYQKKVGEKLIYHRVKKRKGAGGARNKGAKLARGEILVFADSDIILYTETLSYLAETFKDEKTQAAVGTFDKIPANPNPSFFHYFKAFNYYSYWVIEMDRSLPVGGFGGALGSIRKSLFTKLGGFDESFKGAGAEDQDFAWRINQVTKLVFDPRLRVKHYFDNFPKTLKNFYERTYGWMKLFLKYRRFFGPAMNPREALVAGLANISTLLLFLAFFFPFLWPFFVVIFALRIYLGKKFLAFCFKQKGTIFLLVSFFFSHGLYLAVYLGVGRAIFDFYVLQRKSWIVTGKVD
jgi:glycosyltransferase involved in cell wall biosynthesis